MKIKNLIYLTVFYNRSFIEMLKLCLESIKLYSNFSVDTDIIILTEMSFYDEIIDLGKTISIPLSVFVLNIKSIPEAKSSRLLICGMPFINDYTKILYIDTDVLVLNDIQRVFAFDLEDKLYVVRGSDISSEYCGKNLFDLSKYDPKTKGFNSGVLLFKNCENIKSLFLDILMHIQETEKTIGFGSHVDQQFFNYHAITKQMLSNEDKLQNIVVHSQHSFRVGIHSICHFAGSFGSDALKIKHMQDFLRAIGKPPIIESIEPIVQN